MRTAANVSLPHIKAIKVIYMNNFSFFECIIGFKELKLLFENALLYRATL